MSNNRKPACKFYAQGACLKGENCKFLHHNHRKDPSKNICKFYQKGFCPFASQCKFQHVQASWINKSSSAASASSSSSSSSSNTFENENKKNHCWPPHRVVEVEETTSGQNQKHLDEALKRSQEIECSVCWDRVLSKPCAAERRFAVLPECDHPFCISCIRNWRKSAPKSAVRACPICRKPSHFVVPSPVWYCSKEEKQEIIDNYKARQR